MGLQEQYPAYGGRGPGVLGLGIALGVIGTFFIFLRVYVRLRYNKFGTTALIWALSAWFFTIITQVIGAFSLLHGLGNYMEVVVKTNNVDKYLLYTWVTVFFFNMAIPTGKVAVAAYLMEMSGPSNPKIRRSLIAVAALNIIVGIPQVLLVWFQCDPVPSLFDHTKQGNCDHRKSVYSTYLTGAVAAVSDFYLAIVPITILIPLRLDKRLKIGLCFLMGGGIVAGAAAIVRTWAAKWILDPQGSYNIGILFRWGEVEEWLVLITMSVPPTWPVFRPFAQRFLHFTNTATRSRTGAYKMQQTSHSNTASSPAYPPPLVTTTISISSTKDGVASGGPPTPSTVRYTKYGEIIGQDGYSDDERKLMSSVAVREQENESGSDGGRTSTPTLNAGSGNSPRDDWTELEHGLQRNGRH